MKRPARLTTLAAVSLGAIGLVLTTATASSATAAMPAATPKVAANQTATPGFVGSASAKSTLSVDGIKPMAPTTAPDGSKLAAAPTVSTCAQAKSAAVAGKRSSYTCMTAPQKGGTVSTQDVLSKAGASSASPSGAVRPDGLSPDPNSASVPSYCSAGPLGGYFVADRFHECMINRFSFVTYDKNSGGLLGEADVQTIEDDTLAYNNQRDVHIIRLNVYSGWGVTVAGAPGLWSGMNCQSCASLTGDTADHWEPLVVNKPLRATYTITQNDVAQNITTNWATIWYANYSIDKTLPSFRLHQVPNLQCDAEPYMNSTAGCIFTDYVPTFYMRTSDTTYGLSAAAMLKGQQVTPDHWGVKYTDGSGNMLSRVADTATKNANNLTACKGFVKQNSTDSCDEFPFESTYQGAYFVGAGHYYVGHVPILQNAKAGSLLNSFFLANRVTQDSTFWLTVTS